MVLIFGTRIFDVVVVDRWFCCKEGQEKGLSGDYRLFFRWGKLSRWCSSSGRNDWAETSNLVENGLEMEFYPFDHVFGREHACEVEAKDGMSRCLRLRPQAKFKIVSLCLESLTKATSVVRMLSVMVGSITPSWRSCQDHQGGNSRRKGVVTLHVCLAGELGPGCQFVPRAGRQTLGAKR